MADLASLEAHFERTTPYLRPNQVEDAQHERDVLQGMLNAPPHLRKRIEQPSMMRQTIKALEEQLAKNTPTAYQGAELDKAVKREKELRNKIVADMPTRAEMRKAPPGALEKHQRFERLHVESGNMDEWKNIRLRLAASGALPSHCEGSLISNFEVYRPEGGPGELNMDNALIPGKKFSLGNIDSVVFDNDELAILEKMAPKLHAALAFLSANQRREVKEALASETPPEPTVDLSALHEQPANDLRARCRELGLESGGTKDDLIERLQDHYTKPAN